MRTPSWQGGFKKRSTLLLVLLLLVFAHRSAVMPQGRFECLSCHIQCLIEELYSLDTCSHKFCHPCLAEYLHQNLQEKLSGEITCPTCDALISIRDVQDFMRNMGADEAAPV